MPQATRFEMIVTALLTLAALGVAAAVLHREFGTSPVVGARDRSRAPEFLEYWKDLVPPDDSLASGDDGTVVVIEFSDLECPFCRRFHDALGRARDETGVRVRSVFLHYPLPQHRFAVPAARAAECARDQGRFNPFLDAVFRGQDSLGLKAWSRFGAEAGVPDSAAFERCASSTSQPRAVTSGLASGERVGVTGTPTVIIDGWRYYVPPYDSLAQILRAAAQRHAPPQ